MHGLSLYITDGRWRTHQTALLSERPGLVPVAKGNGYGFGVARLAQEARRLGVDTLAVGDATDARQVLDHFAGRIIVLAPTAADDELDDLPSRVVLHITSAGHDTPSGDRRLVIALRTALRCRGVAPVELPALLRRLEPRRIEGFSIHLPIHRRTPSRQAAEVAAWLERLRAAGVGTAPIFVSHLSTTELRALAVRYPTFVLRPTVGTELWLGDPQALHVAGTVVDVVAIPPGERVGYHQRRAWRGGSLVVVAGGTAHGIGLEAPAVPVGLVARSKVLSRVAGAALGRNLSPFSWRGRRLWFAEPPHMLSSALLLPASGPTPAPGAELPVRVRHTITRCDRIVDLP